MVRHVEDKNCILVVARVEISRLHPCTEYICVNIYSHEMVHIYYLRPAEIILLDGDVSNGT